MADLDFLVFDADNHYYEAEDAFTRHVDRRTQKRCMQWAELDGRRRLLVGGQVNPRWEKACKKTQRWIRWYYRRSLIL